MEARVFKVQTIPHQTKYTLEYRKMFDINIKVQQKLGGYLAPNITSLATDKRVFNLGLPVSRGRSTRGRLPLRWRISRESCSNATAPWY